MESLKALRWSWDFERVCFILSRAECSALRTRHIGVFMNIGNPNFVVLKQFGAIRNYSAATSMSTVCTSKYFNSEEYFMSTKVVSNFEEKKCRKKLRNVKKTWENGQRWNTAHTAGPCLPPAQIPVVTPSFATAANRVELNKCKMNTRSWIINAAGKNNWKARVVNKTEAAAVEGKLDNKR